MACLECHFTTQPYDPGFGLAVGLPASFRRTDSISKSGIRISLWVYIDFLRGILHVDGESGRTPAFQPRFVAGRRPAVSVRLLLLSAAR